MDIPVVNCPDIFCLTSFYAKTTGEDWMVMRNYCRCLESGWPVDVPWVFVDYSFISSWFPMTFYRFVLLAWNQPTPIKRVKWRFISKSSSLKHVMISCYCLLLFALADRSCYDLRTRCAPYYTSYKLLLTGITTPISRVINYPLVTNLWNLFGHL